MAMAGAAAHSPFACRLLLLLCLMGLSLLGPVLTWECKAPSSAAPSPVAQLRKSKLCPYNRDAGPTKGNEQRTTIYMHALRFRLDIDEASNTLRLFGYVILMWQDEWLTWDAATYPKVERLYAHSAEIWTPRVSEVESPSVFSIGGEVLIMNGSVIWTHLTPLSGPCRSEPQRWPYDSMQCTISLANLNPLQSKFNSSVRVGMQRWRSKSWLLTDISMPNFTNSHHVDGLTISFNFKRAAGKYEASAVVSALVLGALTLASTWLPSSCAERPTLLGVIIIVQALVSTVIAMHIQVVGDSPPEVLLFHRDSIFLSTAAFCQWLLSRWVAVQKGPTLAHIAPVVGFLATPSGARITSILGLPESTKSGGSRSGSGGDGRGLGRGVSALFDRVAFTVMTLIFALLATHMGNVIF